MDRRYSYRSDGPCPLDREIGRRLSAARLNAGLNQSDLGRALGVTFHQIQKYEKGANRLSASMLLRASRFLDIPPASLLADAGPAHGPSEDMVALLKRPGARHLLRAYGRITDAWHRRLALTVTEGLGPRWRWHDQTSG